jgi:hypothetical protein
LRGHTDVMLDFYKLEQQSDNGKTKEKKPNSSQT